MEAGDTLLDQWIDHFLPWKQIDVQCQQKREKFNPLPTDASSHRQKQIELLWKSTEWFLQEDNIGRSWASLIWSKLTKHASVTLVIFAFFAYYVKGTLMQIWKSFYMFQFM